MIPHMTQHTKCCYCECMKQINKVKKLLDSPEVVTWRSLFVTYRALFSHFESKLQEMGCTVPRLQILLHLYLDGPLSPVLLSKKMNVSRANMTTFIKRLSDEGLIKSTVENASDKRPAWELSAKGIKYFEDLIPNHIANVKKVVEPISDKSLKTLQRIRGNIMESKA